MATVILNQKASIHVHPPMFGEDDPLAGVRPLPQQLQGREVRPGILDFGWEVQERVIPLFSTVGNGSW